MHINHTQNVKETICTISIRIFIIILLYGYCKCKRNTTLFTTRFVKIIISYYINHVGD